MIKIDFAIETQYGTYRDALHLMDDHTFTEAEIEAMKQQRVENWLKVFDQPAEETPPVAEE